MADLRVTGGQQLTTFAAKCKAADKTVMKQVRAGVNKAVKPLGDAIEANALAYMPSGYGPTLAKFLRNRITQRAASANFVITMTTVAEGRSERRAIRLINRGVLRHPVYGRTRRRKWRVVDGRRVRIPGGQPIPNPWVAQKVRAGFWTDAVDKGKDQAVADAAAAMRDVVERLG